MGAQQNQTRCFLAQGPKAQGPETSKLTTELSYNRAVDQRFEEIRLKVTYCNYEMMYLRYACSALPDSEFPDLEVLENLLHAASEVQKVIGEAIEWIQGTLSNIDSEVLGYEVRDEGEALLAQQHDLVNTGGYLKALLLQVKSHLETLELWQ